jgi:hypothetical protein
MVDGGCRVYSCNCHVLHVCVGEREREAAVLRNGAERRGVRVIKIDRVTVRSGQVRPGQLVQASVSGAEGTGLVQLSEQATAASARSSD